MKKGDSVYVVFDDPRIRPLEATIISVGSRYITIDNIHRSSARYHKDTLCSADDASGWNARAKLYKSKEAYEQSIIDSARKNELYTKITELLQEAKDLDILVELYNTTRLLVTRHRRNAKRE